MKIRRRLVGALMGVAAAGTMMTAITPGVANAYTTVNGVLYYELQNVNSGGCLDVRAEDNYYSAGARIQQYTCSNFDEELWRNIDSATAGISQIQSLRSGMCMEFINGETAISAPLVQAPCVSPGSPDYANQEWQFLTARVPTGDGFLVDLLKNQKSGNCIGIGGNSTSNRALADAQACGGTTAQLFQQG